MGGEFSLSDESVATCSDLSEILRSWADAIDDWENKPISEVAIVKDKIVITLKDGVFGV
jgi:hypothetical protein